MDPQAAKLIGAGIALIAILGVGIGVGMIFSAMITAVARNPAAEKQVRALGIFGFAVTEALGLFALLVSLLMLFAL